MTLTFEYDLDRVKHATYLGQRSLSSKVSVQTHRHTTRTVKLVAVKIMTQKRTGKEEK